MIRSKEQSSKIWCELVVSEVVFLTFTDDDDDDDNLGRENAKSK